MIIVDNRELLIPPNERYIGTVYDNNSTIRQFRIPRFLQDGVDLSALQFAVDIQYPNGTKNSALLSKEVQEKYIVGTWNNSDSVLTVAGTYFINLRAHDGSGSVKWASFRAAIYCETTIDTPGSYTGDLTELEQLETLLQHNEELRNAAEEAREIRADEKIAEVDLKIASIDWKTEEFDRDRELLEGYAKTSESWAIGGTGTRAGEDMNNSRYYSIQSQASAEDAENERRICEIIAGTLMPTFHVDFDTGDLMYDSDYRLTFNINRTTGNIEYEVAS